MVLAAVETQAAAGAAERAERDAVDAIAAWRPLFERSIKSENPELLKQAYEAAYPFKHEPEVAEDFAQLKKAYDKAHGAAMQQVPRRTPAPCPRTAHTPDTHTHTL